MNAMTDFKANVELGAALLDSWAPGWALRVKPVQGIGYEDMILCAAANLEPENQLRIEDAATRLLLSVWVVQGGDPTLDVYQFMVSHGFWMGRDFPNNRGIPKELRRARLDEFYSAREAFMEAWSEAVESRRHQIGLSEVRFRIEEPV